jgi:hypothetical protein
VVHRLLDFAAQRDGISTLSLQRALEIGSYAAAWAMLHRLRSVGTAGEFWVLGSGPYFGLWRGANGGSWAEQLAEVEPRIPSRDPS